MQAPQNHLAQTLSKRLIYRDLPILGVAGLLFWLEGNPPSAWVQLIRICAQWGAGGAQEHQALLLPLILQIAQSIMLVIAWGLFFWVIYHEILFLVELYTLHKPHVSSQPQESAPSKPLPKRAPIRIPGSSKGSRSKVLVLRAPELNIHPISIAPSPPPPPTPISFPDNPFEEEEKLPVSSPIPQSSPTHTLKPIEPMALEPVQDLFSTPESSNKAPANETASKSTLSNRFEEKRESTGISIPNKPPHKTIEQHSDEKEQSEILNELGFYRPEKQLAPMIESPDTFGESTAQSGSEIEPILITRAPEHIEASDTNPFDVQSDVIDLFQFDGAIEDQEVISDTDRDEAEEEPTYVFGNPFEGPLPDVFQHDQDLKRMLLAEKSQEESKGNQKPAKQ